MNAIVQYTDPALDDVKRLANLVLALRDDVFKEKLDYGIIPGTGDKPTLLLPGMEKLMRALRLRAEYIERQIIRDYDRPLFHYEYECRLVEYETNICVSTAVGMASSFEKKWRWRQSDRVCPHCGLAAIIKGQEKYGGGWLCFAKKGGCGAKFKDGDKSIEGQTVGRVENEDIFDQINTISKIAQKRALSSAIKGAANVSEFFTVDLEDFQNYDVSAPQSIIVEGRVEEAPRSATQSNTPVQSPPPSENRPLDAKNGKKANGAKETADFICDPFVWVTLSTSGRPYYSLRVSETNTYVFTWERAPFRNQGWNVDRWLHDAADEQGSTEIALSHYPRVTCERGGDGGRWTVKHAMAQEFCDEAEAVNS
jgi:hypothetical protein